MKNKNVLVLLDPGHGSNTPGKKSPDGRLHEYRYNRELASLIFMLLKRQGIDSKIIVNEEVDVPLHERIRRVNDICNEVGKSNVLLLSIHCNAAGDGSQWMNATGWECYTSPGKTKADRLAESIFREAQNRLPVAHKMRADWSDGDPDKEARFYMLMHSKCPAVLTENLFMDSKKDVEYMLTHTCLVNLAEIHVIGILKYLDHG